MKPPVGKITVYIVDSQRLFRKIATLGLSHYQDIEVTGGCDFSEDIQIIVKVFSPKVVLLSVDDYFRGGPGLRCQVTTCCPVAEVMALTSKLNDTQLLQVIKSGMGAYVDNEVSAEELGGIIKKVARGPLLRDSVSGIYQFAEGNPNKQIAHILKINEQTNKNHIISILQKPDANDHRHASVLAIRLGWLSLEKSAEEIANN